MRMAKQLPDFLPSAILAFGNQCSRLVHTSVQAMPGCARHRRLAIGQLEMRDCWLLACGIF